MNKKRKRTVRYLFVVLLAFIILLLRFTEEIGFDKEPGERFYIAKVIDGDTVELAGGDKLRLLSVDTPEKGELFYEEARAFLTSIALQKKARIEYVNYRRDKYGRLLGYLYIDTLFVNKMILDSGLGYLYLFKDTEINQRTDLMLKAQRQALSDELGIWSVEKLEEDYYINRIGSFRLHRPGCKTLSNITETNHRKFKNRSEGFIEGLSPCRICKP